MKKTFALIALSALCSTPALAQVNVANIIDMELLTHTELSQKLKDGWTSVILVTGGTEERGPQDVLGGHTMMAHSHASMIAKKLGKTLVAPVLPIAVNATEANAQVFQVRDGVLSDRQSFYLDNEGEYDVARAAEEFLLQYYASAMSIPALIAVRH